jgi:hypothetical protein
VNTKQIHRRPEQRVSGSGLLAAIREKARAGWMMEEPLIIERSKPAEQVRVSREMVEKLLRRQLPWAGRGKDRHSHLQ